MVSLGPVQGSLKEATRKSLLDPRNRVRNVCRIVKDRIRLWKAGVRDAVMELCCALHNFRVRLTPWQPMV